ncbi:hypothetical protein [Massilia sp. TS11]|uniref:hypothetical protein n=1 Tax=Massilia sp. TS11 TaxID=2908003 RepID=UPI001EDACF06|nr:hypothetical protein [Massilia sp. TS11]MCG2584745.1 hypothetical protein [Massilia sp. TS11]
MKPFENEAEVIEIGALCIENRLDRISLHGDLDLTLDQAGLRQARALQALLNAVVAAMEARPLPAELPPPAVGEVDNPFL